MKKSKHHLFYLFSSFICVLILSCGSPGAEVDEGDTTGISEKEIRIGSWGPLTGPAALWGSIMKGMDAYFKMINAEGGIHGRQINFIYKDDAYDPSKTVPVLRELVQKEEIFAACGGIGTAPNMAVFDFIKDNNVPWITPFSGATFWTHPVQKHIYTSFPLYFDEGDVQAKYAIHDLKVKKIAIIYQNDDFGKSGLVGAKNTLQKNNLDFVAALPVEISDTDLSSHAARLKNAGAEVVLLWMLPRQAAIILNSCAVIDFKPQWISSFVLSDMGLMHNITKGGWEGVIFNSTLGYSPYDTTQTSIAKYKIAYETYFPEERWGIFPLGGFLWSEMLVEGLRRAGKDINRTSFLQAFETMQNWQGPGGMPPLTFTPDNHVGTRTIYLAKCKSATEMDFLSGPIKGDSNVEALEAMLKTI